MRLCWYRPLFCTSIGWNTHTCTRTRVSLLCVPFVYLFISFSPIMCALCHTLIAHSIGIQTLRFVGVKLALHENSCQKFASRVFDASESVEMISNEFSIKTFVMNGMRLEKYTFESMKAFLSFFFLYKNFNSAIFAVNCMQYTLSLANKCCAFELER